MKVTWTSLAALLVTGALSAGGTVENTSYVAPDGHRILRHEAVVEAPVDSVWDAFTTHDGVTAWMVPRAIVDFRVGGTLETSYDLESPLPHPDNIKHEFLAYLPHEMIAMRVINCPPGFAHADVLESLWWVTTLAPAGDGRTRVSIAGVGFGEGEAHDEIYRYFDQGNAWTLEQLQKRFSEGPVDWARKAAEARESVKRAAE